jgi:hypothetical protein
VALAIPPSIIGLQVAGDAFGMTFYRSKTQGQVVYNVAKSAKKPRGGCVTRITLFVEAHRQWNLLSPAAKADYEYLTKAGHYPMTGCNLWVKLCLTQSLPLYHTLLLQSHLPLAPPVLL